MTEFMDVDLDQMLRVRAEDVCAGWKLSKPHKAQLESCSGLGSLAALGCNTRNAGRNAAAAGLGAALTQKYQGQVVRDLAGAQTLRFEVGNRRLELQGDLLHVASGTRALVVAGRFVAGGGGH